ncbi:B3 DNA binding domain [Forsythia ovata]|uniref:B3 DNA binding domain n=1 Tax=Forsythia ovata TaxID=205694 RepID=A0ABD1WNY7_9LAMI
MTPTSISEIIRLDKNHAVHLPLPQVFADEFAHQLADTIILIDCFGIHWDVQLQRVNNTVFLSSGWEHFVDHHTLEDDYVLMFEYIGNSIFYVTLLDNSSVARTFQDGISDEEFSTLGYPAFTVTLEARLQCHQKIYIPGTFSRRHLPLYKENVEIHDSAGNVWPIRTNIRQNGDVRCLTIGWTYFATAKGLGNGDKCMFELVDDHDDLPSQQGYFWIKARAYVGVFNQSFWYMSCNTRNKVSSADYNETYQDEIGIGTTDLISTGELVVSGGVNQNARNSKSVNDSTDTHPTSLSSFKSKAMEKRTKTINSNGFLSTVSQPSSSMKSTNDWHKALCTKISILIEVFLKKVCKGIFREGIVAPHMDD